MRVFRQTCDSDYSQRNCDNDNVSHRVFRKENMQITV